MHCIIRIRFLKTTAPELRLKSLGDQRS